MSLCPCGSQLEDKDCCLPVLEGAKKAPTAEALMRARYTAHVLKKYDFLVESAHPEFRDDVSPSEIEEWSSVMDWKSLEILGTKEGLEMMKQGK